MPTVVSTLDLNSPAMKWAVILFILAVITYTVIRPAMKRKKDPLFKSPSSTSQARQRNVERQMQNLLVELSEMARQITAQLDTRSAKLQELIAEADERIAALSSLSAAPPADAQSGLTTNPFNPDPAPTVGRDSVETEAAAAEVRHREIYSLADDGRSPLEIAKLLDRQRGEIELILTLRSRR